RNGRAPWRARHSVRAEAAEAAAASVDRGIVRNAARPTMRGTYTFFGELLIAARNDFFRLRDRLPLVFVGARKCGGEHGITAGLWCSRVLVAWRLLLSRLDRLFVRSGLFIRRRRSIIVLVVSRGAAAQHRDGQGHRESNLCRGAESEKMNIATHN